MAAGILAAWIPSAEGQAPADTLRIHFLDVGQGDAALVEAPGDRHVLLDAGPAGSGVAAHLERLGVDTLDLVVVSHNHADHIGGATAVLEAFPVRFFMDNGVPHTTETYRSLVETLAEEDVPLLEPERRSIGMGPAELEILPPPGDPELGQNDNSVGVSVTFGDFRALVPGDAEERLWDHWLRAASDALGPVQVLRASHHGSRHGDTSEALARLRPELVVVSAGRENEYGHPHPEALARYREVGAEILVTAWCGTITVAATSDGSFRVETERSGSGQGAACRGFPDRRTGSAPTDARPPW